MIVQMEIGIDAEHPHTQRVVKLAESCGLRTEVKTTKGTGATVTEVHMFDHQVKAGTVAEHVFRPLPGVSQVRRVTPSAVSLTANGSGSHHVRLGPVAVGNDLPCQLIVGPYTVDRHIGVLVAAQLAALGINAPLLLMLSNGGMTHVDEAKRTPVQLLESGPAAGAIAAIGATATGRGRTTRGAGR